MWIDDYLIKFYYIIHKVYNILCNLKSNFWFKLINFIAGVNKFL